jgi:hypothetical protein
MIDFIQLDPGFALVETTAPKDLAGRSLAEAHVRQRYGITDELDVRGRPLAALFDQLRDDVDADDLAHERRESDRERAGAGTDISSARSSPVSVSRWRSRSCVAAVRNGPAAARRAQSSRRSASERRLKGPAPPPWSASFPRRAPPRSVPAYDRVGCQIRVRRNAPICRRNRIYEPFGLKGREHVAWGEIERRQEHARPPNRRQRPRLGWQAPLGCPPRLGREVVPPVASSCLSPEGYCS